MVQPLIVGREKIGILALVKRREDASFSQGDLELLAVLASQAGTAIQNARLFTRLRNAYEKLSDLDHLKSEFISVVAHELRTPLAEIATYVALSEQETRGARPYLDGIARAAERLTSLMNDITDLKFLEAGQVELRPTALSLPQERLLGVHGLADDVAADAVLPQRWFRAICRNHSPHFQVFAGLVPEHQYADLGGRFTYSHLHDLAQQHRKIRDAHKGLAQLEERNQRLQARVLPFQPGSGKGFGDCGAEVIQGERLQQEIVHAQLERFDGRIH